MKKHWHQPLLWLFNVRMRTVKPRSQSQVTTDNCFGNNGPHLHGSSFKRMPSRSFSPTYFLSLTWWSRCCTWLWSGWMCCFIAESWGLLQVTSLLFLLSLLLQLLFQTTYLFVIIFVIWGVDIITLHLQENRRPQKTVNKQLVKWPPLRQKIIEMKTRLK